MAARAQSIVVLPLLDEWYQQKVLAAEERLWNVQRAAQAREPSYSVGHRLEQEYRTFCEGFSVEAMLHRQPFAIDYRALEKTLEERAADTSFLRWREHQMLAALNDALGPYREFIGEMNAYELLFYEKLAHNDKLAGIVTESAPEPPTLPRIAGKYTPALHRNTLVPYDETGKIPLRFIDRVFAKKFESLNFLNVINGQLRIWDQTLTRLLSGKEEPRKGEMRHAYEGAISEVFDDVNRALFSNVFVQRQLGK